MKTIYFILAITLSFSVKNAVSAQPKYNVLFIAVDDMNDKCVLFGNKEAVSPNLQRLAAHGMVFTSAYAQFPLCNPSRTSVLSGLRPDRTRVKNNSTRPRDVMGNSVVFLPEYFRQNGYRTERYGKIMHGSFENDISWNYAEPAENTDTTDLWSEGKQEGHSSEVKWYVHEDTVVISGDTLTRNLIASMQQYHSKPFFYGLGLEQTHLAFNPSLKQWNRNGDSSVSQLLKSGRNGDYNGLRGNGSSNILLPNTLQGDRNDVPAIAFPSQIVLADTEWRNMIHAYYSEVSLVDEQLGRVLDELDRQHLWDKTVVVLWSDHGQHLGEHEGCWRKNTLFEESLHVPLIVCVPGKAPGVCSRLVELVDLYPTISEVCGLPVPAGLEGTSFAPLIDNPGFRWKTGVFSQVSQTAGDLGRSVTTANGRYNYWGDKGEELYQHEADPKEYNNLAGIAGDSAALNNMRQILTDGWRKISMPIYKKLTRYRDADNDGYGSARDTLFAYASIPGYVLNNKDCDDTDPSANPDATEICDGKDNNCDGFTDEICLPDISMKNQSISEGDAGLNNMIFEVNLSHAYNQEIKIKYKTKDKTATSEADYLDSTGVIKFQPGEINKTFSVQVLGDKLSESDEVFKIVLSSPLYGSVNVVTATATIKNDDGVIAFAQNQNIQQLYSVSKTTAMAEVWPNPANNIVNVQLHTTNVGKIKIALININGAEIKEWKDAMGFDQLIQLDLLSIPNGAYFLIISDEKGKKQTEKLLVQH